jgi:hypothetical protein
MGVGVVKRFIWFHPSYILETDPKTIKGQIKNAKRHHYTVLAEDELYKVHAWDHLTIVGHSTAPKSETEDQDTSTSEDDTGFYIQGETAKECVSRLRENGLKVPPKILSMECCRAGIIKGIAHQISEHPFFKTTVIETNTSGIGRNPGNIHWGMLIDSFGRAVVREDLNPWLFLLGGKTIAKHKHAEYTLQQVLEKVLPYNFHTSFFSFYHPGFFGGRVGRYCKNGIKITLEQATLFAEKSPNSATANALTSLMLEPPKIT